MSLFCRASRVKFLEKKSNDYFELMTRSIKYFENLFGYPYPFSKYDQIFCPEFSVGAMENPGAVTINDAYIHKEDVPLALQCNVNNTLVHELSHMWFGNLVTMKWWDDLWLNESFAEFISHQCQWDLKDIEGVDVRVIAFHRKMWGYIEDQMITTHPVYSEVENTDQADNIFDGITYAKGAGLIK